MAHTYFRTSSPWTMWGLVAALAQTPAAAQQVPEDYFRGVRLESPLPTRLSTGQIVRLEGRIDDATLPQISFIFSQVAGGAVLEFRARVVDGRFAQPIFFGHSEAGEYLLEVWFFPLQGPGRTSIRFHSIQVEEGSGPIEVPAEYYYSLVDRALFEPNVMASNDLSLPPLYVRTGGQVEEVTAFVRINQEPVKAYKLRDDGREGDALEGDGIYTRTGIPYSPGELAMGDFGSLLASVQIVYADGSVAFERAECGIVGGEQRSQIASLGENARRGEYALNLVDRGDLFRASGRVPGPVVGHGFSNEYGLDLHQIGRYFYEHFADDFDFLVVRSAHSLINGLHGVHLGVRNQVDGLGLERFDRSGQWGSQGRLRSALFINFRMVGPMIHELAHSWANHLELFDSALYGGHWGFSDVGGVLGGYATSFEEVEPGVYAVDNDAAVSYWGGEYADLELYLMGLVPAREVGPHRILRDFRFVGEDTERGKIAFSGRVDTVTIDDIIAAVGPRVPAFDEAQKAFRLGTVVASFEPLDALALTYYDRQMAQLGSDADHPFAFAAATGYRATMDTRLDPPNTAVATAGQAQESAPDAALLLQNYPNPFNGGTVIGFALPRPGRVQLTVYNLAGQQVAVLLEEQRDAGFHAASWDGRDGRGRALASGVYLYRLQVGQQVQTRKLSLVR